MCQAFVTVKLGKSMNKIIKIAAQPMLKAVLFDLDGTLVHSTVNFLKLKKQTLDLLARVGLSHDLFSLDMKTYEILQLASSYFEKRGYSESDIEKIFTNIERVWNQIELELVGKTTSIDGVRETLRELKKRELKIGVVTRGCRKYAEDALRRSSLISMVDVIVGRDDALPKPRPDPLIKALRLLELQADEVVMVGDGVDDAQCATNSKVRFIGIDSKVTNNNLFHDLPCVTVIPNLPHLLHILALK